MVQVLVKFSEIALKGSNRSFFISRLVANIQKSSNRYNLDVKIIKEHSRIICIYDESSKKEDIVESLSNVYGIKYFGFESICQKNVTALKDKIIELLKGFKDKPIKTISFKTKRSDKDFEMTSPQINSSLSQITKEMGFIPDYKEYDIEINIEVALKKIHIYAEKYEGLSGLPVGTSGKVLVLMSGGIDSPVATTEILKRGCTADFLHIHTFPNNNIALDNKIKDLVKILNKYQFKSKLFLLPYYKYDFMIQGKIPKRYDLIFFKHYIFKLAERIAKEKGYDAIISGDSLNQVASQTIENIKCTNYSIDLPILRPLISHDKEEIINKAIKIGTFDTSLINYKDCCSLMAKNPLTQTNISKFISEISKIEMNSILSASLNEMEEFWIK